MSPAAALHLATIARALARILAPPAPPRSLVEFANTVVIRDKKNHPVPLDWRGHPAQRATILLWARGAYRRMVVLGPPQDGKTVLFAVLLLYSLVELGHPSMYAVTDQRLATNLWSQKMLPMVRESGHGWVLPTAGPGSGTGNPDSVLFNTGAWFNRLGAGAQNGAGQAGITSRLSVIDEASKIRGKQLTFLQDRNRSYADEAETVLTGTLEKDLGDYLLAEYERSTAGRLHYPCPHCGGWQPLEWKRVQLDLSSETMAQASAVLACAHCPALLTDAERVAMLPLGVLVMAGQRVELVDGQAVVTGDPPPVLTAGLRWTALDSPLQNLGALAVEFQRATELKTRFDDHDALRQFHHAALVEPYLDADDTLALREIDLATRSAQADYAIRTLPGEVDFVVISIDVQLRSVYWEALGWNVETGQSWILDYGRVPVCMDGVTPTEQQMHAALDVVDGKAADGWSFDNGTTLTPVRGGIDTADGNTRPWVLTWLARRPSWHALRGQSERITPDIAAGTAVFRLPGVLAIYHQTTARPSWYQIAINVDQMKAEVYRAFARAPGSPGAMHLPSGEAADGPLIMQLTAERQEPTATGPRWVRRRKNNHYLDVTAYNVAFARWQASIMQATTESSAVDLAAAIARGDQR